MTSLKTFGRVRVSTFAMLALAALAGCGGGAPTETNPNTSGTVAAANYNGPPPSTADIQAFKLNVWDNLQGDDKCGTCHKPNQSPRFVRSDDINLAYQEANTVVDLANPGLSRMVVKVRGGHHCWLSDNNACGDTLTRWITAWASVTGGGGGKTIQLIEPALKDAGASKSFPADAQLFAGVWKILKDNCSRCHTATSPTQQQPYFASSDLAEAYAAAQPKMNMDDPSQSRFVLRLGNEFHNCWAPNGGAVSCPDSAKAMEDAIKVLAGVALVTPIEPGTVLSKALAMYDGTVASGGNRYDNNAIAMYEFKTGSGPIAYDTSGVSPAMDLQLENTTKGSYAWVGGWGMQFTGGKARAFTTTSKKLSDMIGATGEYSIETWAAPANVTQTEARIVTYSGGVTARNFELGQTVYNYDFFNRTTNSNANGSPTLSTPDAAKVLQASLQHVVVTFDPVKGRRIYVNGVFTGTADNAPASIGTKWDDTFAFVLGNEVSGDKPWLGQIKFVAIHNRALTLPQIQQNFAAGVGERYFVLFSISHLVNIPKSYIMFEVTQYDSYAYLFKDPKFISLDANARPGDLVLKGMRIGINGAEATVGQAYSTLDMVLTDALYTTSGGESLSNVGTIIGLQKGPVLDQFYLTFDQLGTQTHVHTEPTVPVVVTTLPGGTRPADVGMRTFDAVNSTMSKITGVDINNPTVIKAYAAAKQSLPISADFGGFQDSHQSAINGMAIAYCTEVVKSPTLSNAFFGTSSPDVSTPSGRSQVIDAVVGKVFGSTLTTQPLTTQPDETASKLEIDRLLTNPGVGYPGPGTRAPGLCVSATCTGARNTQAVAAACVVGLASGAMAIQ
jgi:hypothetical protein